MVNYHVNPSCLNQVTGLAYAFEDEHYTFQEIILKVSSAETKLIYASWKAVPCWQKVEVKL